MWTTMTSLRHAVDNLERTPRLDPLVTALTAFWERVLPGGRVRDLLHGTWLGHPLHPMLTDLPIGFWTSAMALDLARQRQAARTMTGAGVLTALPTAVVGAADWVAVGDFDRPKRVGAVHAVANTTALALYTASWLARRKGRHTNGALLGVAGATAATVGGYLGGHLAFRNAVGVDHTAGENAPGEWTDVGLLRELPMRQAVRKRVDGTDVLLYRLGSTVRAVSATCSHLGGPLDEGEIADDCVTCPWHGSTFRLTDGEVLHGPATAPQPAYDVRVVGRTVQVRRRVEERVAQDA